MVLDETNNSFMRGYLMGGLFVRKSCSKCVFMEQLEPPISLLAIIGELTK